MGDCIGRTRLHAETAENAAVVIDVVNLGVTVAAADAFRRKYSQQLQYRCSPPGKLPRQKKHATHFLSRFRRAAKRAPRGNVPAIAPAHPDKPP